MSVYPSLPILSIVTPVISCVRAAWWMWMSSYTASIYGMLLFPLLVFCSSIFLIISINPHYQLQRRVPMTTHTEKREEKKTKVIFSTYLSLPASALHIRGRTELELTTKRQSNGNNKLFVAKSCVTHLYLSLSLIFVRLQPPKYTFMVIRISRVVTACEMYSGGILRDI